MKFKKIDLLYELRYLTKLDGRKAADGRMMRDIKPLQNKC